MFGKMTENFSEKWRKMTENQKIFYSLYSSAMKKFIWFYFDEQ